MRSVLTAAVIGICFIAQTLAGVVADASNSIPGYEIVELSWKVQAFPNGPNITVNGTVENAIAKIAELNPNWKTDFDVDNRVAAASSTDNIPWDEWDSPPRCGAPWKPVYLTRKSSPIDEGINYLLKLPGVPEAGPGPKKCIRASCSWNAAIYWCNDHPEKITLASSAWIAKGAKEIVHKCVFRQSRRSNGVSGQIFNKGAWNVIVRQDSDHC